MIKYQFASRKQQVLICAPRRMGKTFATALLAAVLVIVVPDIEVSIFLPGKRQSVALMGAVIDFVGKLGESNRIIQRNEEKMKVRSLDGSLSKLNAYPSAVRTLKGVSGTVVILEELAQIPPEVLYEVVVPLHQLERTSIIGISTITSEDNFFTKYLEQKDLHGEPLFAVTHIHLACKPCRDKDEAHKCNHNAHLLPAWSSKRKRKIINAIMRGQEEMLAREIGGVASALHQRAFPTKLINQFANMERLSLPYNETYDYVFHSIDPAAAGKQSEIAITSVIRRGGMHLIVGLESFPCKTAKENHSLIIEHVNQLRSDTRFCNTISVFIFESNLGMESDHMATMLEENIGYFVVMNERDDGIHTGFRTTHNMKMLAVENLREKIMDGAVRIANPDTKTCVSRSPEALISMLIEQMKEFREMLKPSEIAQPKKFYSGKVGGGKDDLLMTLLLNVHWSGYFYRSSKYEHFHR